MPRDQHTFWGDFRTFFVRGLAVLLPSIVTLWLLWQAFVFLFANVAEPINRGVRIAIVEITPRVAPSWLEVTDEELATFRTSRTVAESPVLRDATDETLVRQIRRQEVRSLWDDRFFGVLNLTGLVIAIILLYLAGRLLGSFVGRWAYARVEDLLRAVPGFKQVYPHVKQVVDLVMGDQKMAFSRVVLVEYPRKGIWTVGLVTSSSLKPIADQAGGEVLCVFIPTSPTPFTGFTINVPAGECVDVDMTIDQALRFVITAGVLVPERLQMPAASGVPQLHVPNGQAGANPPGAAGPPAPAGELRTEGPGDTERGETAREPT